MVDVIELKCEKCGEITKAQEPSSSDSYVVKCRNCGEGLTVSKKQEPAVEPEPEPEPEPEQEPEVEPVEPEEENSD